MGGDLKNALEALHDLRQFWFDNVTQTKVGAGHHNPVWLRVAVVLDKNGMDGPGAPDGLRPDPAYRCQG